MFENLAKEVLMIIFKNKIKMVLEKDAYKKKEIYNEIKELSNILYDLERLIK